MFKLLLFLFLLTPCGSRRSRQEAICGPADRRAVSKLRPPQKVPAAYSLQCQSQPPASSPSQVGFFGKWLARLVRVGAGAAWMWGEGPCGRPLLGYACSSPCAQCKKMKRTRVLFGIV